MKKTQNIIADEMAKDKDKWVDFMMKYELGLEKPNVNRARNSAATIGISYIIGGLIPLTGYFFTPTPFQGLLVSSVLTVICLFLFGYFKSKVTGQPLLRGAIKVTLIGITAAAAAFWWQEHLTGCFNGESDNTKFLLTMKSFISNVE